VPLPVSAAAAARLRMHRVRAFGVWAADGGLPSRLFYHPQVSDRVPASDFWPRFGTVGVCVRVGWGSTWGWIRLEYKLRTRMSLVLAKGGTI